MNNFFNNFSPKTSFIMGFVGGIMALCTIGFVILLVMVLGGGSFKFPTLGEKKLAGSKTAPTDVSAGTPISVAIGLKQDDFQSCLESGRHANRVEQDYQDAIKSGGQGTPYSIVVAANGQTFPINGAFPFEDVKSIIDQALAVSANAPLPKTSDESSNVRSVGDSDHLRGDPKATVKVVEFSDLECPFCKNFHRTMQQVMEEYSDKVAWVYRHFPLDSLHPKARKEAEATECAAELQGNDGFWAYVDKLFEITPSNNGLDPNLL